MIKLYMSGHRLIEFQYVRQKNVETFNGLIFQFEEQCLIHIFIVLYNLTHSIGISYLV
jgi:hypothetical protein